MQQEGIGVTGEKKQGRPWPGNGLNSRRKKKEDSENSKKNLWVPLNVAYVLVNCAYHIL